MVAGRALGLIVSADEKAPLSAVRGFLRVIAVLTLTTP
jgi:hypothetical protein